MKEKLKSQKNLPVILLNEANLDFIFDIFDANGYRVGLGDTPGYENKIVRADKREDIKRWQNEDKNPAICYVEIDPIRKRYLPLTRWFENTKEMRKFIGENINHPYSEPINYWNKYEMIKKDKKC